MGFWLAGSWPTDCDLKWEGGIVLEQSVSMM